MPAREAADFGDHVSIKRLVLRYVAMAAITLVAVALVAAVVARRVGTSTAVDDADRAARLVAGSAVEPALQDGIAAMDPAAIGAARQPSCGARCSAARWCA